MKKQLKDYLDKQEDAVFEAGIKGLALFCIAALVIIGIAFLINYVGF